MPHLTLEYSANVEDRLDISALCSVALEAAASTGAFEKSAARARAIRCDHYAIADEHPQNGFIDASFRLRAGRSEADRQATGKAIWDAMRAFCAPLYETQFFALSLEVREIDPVLSWKDNGIKPRIQRERLTPTFAGSGPRGISA